MNPQILQFSRLLLPILILNLGRSCLGADNENYTRCGQSYNCANIANINYPFWGGERPEYCGHPSFGLNCAGDAPLLTIGSTVYRVLSIDNKTVTLTVVEEEFWNNACPQNPQNASLDAAHFSYASGSEEVTLYYGCQMINQLVNQISSTPNKFNCSTTAAAFYVTRNGIANVSSIPANMLPTCTSSVNVRINQTAEDALSSNTPSMNITQALDGGFGLVWEANNTPCSQCVESGGRCGYNSSASFVCYCSDQTHPSTCFNTTGGGSNSNIKIGLPIAGAVIAGVGLGWAIFAYRQKRNRKAALEAETEHSSLYKSKSKDLPSPPLSKGPTTPSTNYSRSIPSFASSKTEFGKASTYFGVQVFSYSELEEATNNFDPSMELGDGGFGTVYYGKLHDGRVVAVKRLYENNFKRVEQFMNEVEILTRLRHENLVTLYGCTSKRSRELLLVYEYIPNGTVADHLHGKRSNSGLLSLPIRLSIAIETADALAYLHQSTIIHRDVKTNNILLDNDFRVKVADFGLSRLFPNDVTHVSTAPQGTPGYVDPEYYQCYQLTEKSDVYSFGVVLIELISSKQAVDTNRERHDINLANMAVNKIQNHALHELVDPSLGFETNASVRRMTTLVAELAFRCLQMERDMRPSMDEVLKALRGIKNEELNGEKAEVVDIIVEDESGPLKGIPPPMSPDSSTTEKNASSSTMPNSFG